MLKIFQISWKICRGEPSVSKIFFVFDFDFWFFKKFGKLQYLLRIFRLFSDPLYYRGQKLPTFCLFNFVRVYQLLQPQVFFSQKKKRFLKKQSIDCVFELWKDRDFQLFLATWKWQHLYILYVHMSDSRMGTFHMLVSSHYRIPLRFETPSFVFKHCCGFNKKSKQNFGCFKGFTLR